MQVSLRFPIEAQKLLDEDKPEQALTLCKEGLRAFPGYSLGILILEKAKEHVAERDKESKNFQLEEATAGKSNSEEKHDLSDFAFSRSLRQYISIEEGEPYTEVEEKSYGSYTDALLEISDSLEYDLSDLEEGTELVTDKEDVDLDELLSLDLDDQDELGKPNDLIEDKDSSNDIDLEEKVKSDEITEPISIDETDIIQPENPQKLKSSEITEELVKAIKESEYSYDHINKMMGDIGTNTTAKKRNENHETDDSEYLKNENIEMTETIANIYWQQEEFSDAIDAFKQLIKIYPEKENQFKSTIKEIKKEAEAKRANF
ncbi:MAG: hypothetical protein Kapaf2KO_10020 [Candidatus Kapaibacteriales bacterium]